MQPNTNLQTFLKHYEIFICDFFFLACQLSLVLAYFVWSKIILPLWPREAERLDTLVVKCLAEFPFEVWRYDGNIHSDCVLDLSVNMEVQFK